MIPTKTYPLSAIIGNQLTDKERIAELEAQLKHAEGHAAELEAEVMEFRSRGTVALSSWDEERERALREGERVVALEAEVKTLREALNKYSEDEMLLIERCAKVCEQIETASRVKYKQDYGGYWEGSCDGAGNCVVEIRALAPRKERPEECPAICPNCVTPWKCNGPHITGGPEFTAHIDAAIDAERKGK